jgi:hypothetical protein
MMQSAADFANLYDSPALAVLHGRDSGAPLSNDTNANVGLGVVKRHPRQRDVGKEETNAMISTAQVLQVLASRPEMETSSPPVQ